MARVEIVGRAVEFVEIDEELRGLIAAPRRADERAGDRLHRAVGVAILPDQAGFDRVLPRDVDDGDRAGEHRSEEHTSELQSLMRNSYAVFCLKKTKIKRYMNIDKE